MIFRLWIGLMGMIVLTALPMGCDDSGNGGDAPDDGDTGRDDTSEDGSEGEQVDTAGEETDEASTDVDDDTAVNVDVTADQTIGSACSCEGGTCFNAVYSDVPMPNGEPMVGCDDVPDDVPGASRVCLRSYQGDNANETHFANGYCALQATMCESGPSMVCSAATFGEYDSFVACPEGTLMLANSVVVETVLGDATMLNKICVRACAGNDDCRGDEIDPVWDGAASGYECVVRDSEGFCYNPANLGDDYTISAN